MTKEFQGIVSDNIHAHKVRRLGRSEGDEYDFLHEPGATRKTREGDPMTTARRRRRNSKSQAESNEITDYRAELWRMADALRGSMDAAEYKHVVLGLIFLKYISDDFEERHAEVLAEWGEVAAEDRDEYIAENIFRVPPKARWPHLKAQARQPTIGQLIDTISNIQVGDEESRSKDVLGRVYE